MGMLLRQYHPRYEAEPETPARKPRERKAKAEAENGQPDNG